MPVQYPTGIIAEHLATRSAAGLFDVSHMGRFVLRGPGAAAVPPARADQQRRGARPAAGAVHDGAHRDRRRRRRRLPVPLRRGRVPARRQRLEPAQGLGPLPRPPRALPRRRDERRDRRDRDGGPAGPGVARDPCRPDRDRRAAGAAAQRARHSHAAAGRRASRRGAHRAHRLHRRAGGVRALRGRARRTGALGRAGRRLAPRRSASAPATPCVSRPACRSTATSWAPTRTAARSPSSAARSRPSRSASRRARATSSGARRSNASSAPTRASCSATGRCWRTCRGSRGLSRSQAAASPVRARRSTPPRVTTGSAARLSWAGSRAGPPCPYWGLAGEGLCSSQTEEHELRSIALAYLDSRVLEDDEVEVDVRGRRVPGLVVPYHLRSDAPPCARAIIWDYTPQLTELEGGEAGEKALRLLNKAIANHEWRQEECINLIPSEMTAFAGDPAAEHHRPVRALRRAQEGRGLLRRRRLLLPGHRLHRRGGAAARRASSARTSAARRSRPAPSAARWPTRPCSARWSTTSTAPTARPSRGASARSSNNHIGKGGHLSAQPMGALRDYVARDPRTELPGGRRHPRAARQPVQGGRRRRSST